MIRFLKSKLRSKRWLNLSLLIGFILLAGVVACHPMFLRGSLDRLLKSAFQNYIRTENAYPITLSRAGMFDTNAVSSVDALVEKLAEYREKWKEFLKLDTVEEQTEIRLVGCDIESNLGATHKYMDIAYAPGMDEHIRILKGMPLSEAQTEDGALPCMISTKIMDNFSYSFGEILCFSEIKDKQGNPLKVKIAGIFEEAEADDIYWCDTASKLEHVVYVTKENLDSLWEFSGIEKVSYIYHNMLDYGQLNSANELRVRKNIEKFLRADDKMQANCLPLLKKFEKDSVTTFILLVVMELSMVLLLLAFIYMVSGQILSMETGEIAMMKSRGISRMEVVKLYTLQSLVLGGLGVLFGLPLGVVICKLAASADSFLIFSNRYTGDYRFVFSAIPYSICGVLVGCIFMVLPAFSYSKLSIVEQKGTDKRANKPSFWEKYFLDLLLVAISSYLLYNYNQQKSAIALSVLNADTIDPVIFLNSSLFMLACGLVMLRLMHYLVRLIYYLGRKRWSPAMYASFLQITRTFRKQGFISIFLVMTLSMGIFNSNMVRTINENEVERIAYNNGTDVRVQENWFMSCYLDKKSEVQYRYVEPDYGRFDGLVDDGILESMTRVYYSEKAVVKTGKTTDEKTVLMGISTKEFGETAMLKDGLNGMHWYVALNELAKEPNGLIISSSLADVMHKKVGDRITFTVPNPLRYNEELPVILGKIVAIVDAWPGYNGYAYVKGNASSKKTKTEQDSEDEEKEPKTITKEIPQYLIVANRSFLVSGFKLLPYEIWGKLKQGKTSYDFQEYLDSIDLSYNEVKAIDRKIVAMKEEPLIQITNGMYTMSFLVAILVCLIGFLIYWVTSIKQRELLFGIYRAMGMNMRELNKMLINEQIFSSLFAVIGGTGVGILSTLLFTKLVAVVYLPESHNIPIALCSEPWDMVRLFSVVAVMFIVCIFVLRSLLKNMKITQALKLGED